MNIGIDIDDTISDTFDTFFPYAQKYTIEDLKRDGKIQRCNSDTHKYIQAMHAWNDEEDLGFWDKYYIELIDKVKVKPFAKEVITKLSKNNEITIITARWDYEGEPILKLTKKWLKENGIVYDKLLNNINNKVNVAKEHNIELFIDDSFYECKQMIDGGIKTFMMDSKTNETINDNRITRVYSWPHIYQEYEKIINNTKM